MKSMFILLLVYLWLYPASVGLPILTFTRRQTSMLFLGDGCWNKSSFFFFLRLECCHLKIVSDICPQVWMTIANLTIFTFWSNFFFQKYVRHVVLITMSFPEFYMYVTPYLVRQIVHSSWFLISIRHIGWTAALHAHVPRMVHGSRQT